jgi:hypothetical protein
MPAQPQLEANLVVAGSFIVGANPQPPNQFKVSISNKGDSLQLTPKKCLYLTGTLGPGQEALFLDEADAQKCNKSSSKDWKVLWDFSRKEEGIFRLKIFSFKKFGKDQTVTISFSNVISKTAPQGAVALSFETDFSDAKQALTISKTAKDPDIISFYSDPPEGVPNLPGTEVTLKWRTFKLTNRELFQSGISDPLSCNFDKDEGAKTITCGPADMTFTLNGYHGAKKISRQLRVKVLKSGWYDLRNTVHEGDPGYLVPETEHEIRDLEIITKGLDLEPTLLFNATNLLYAIFRLRFADKVTTFLFQTQNPFGGWRFVKSTVPHQAGFIPEGFATSPGVYCDDKLWLIGGSQIDPDNTSNHVWCFDPKKSAWEDRGAANWPPRMGHAVQVVFEDQKEQIWVMGGRDEAGNALNDVWALDGKDPLPQKAWEPRCLFNTAVYDKKIWLYGGAKEPFSAELYDDLYVYTGGGNWQKKEMTGIIKGSESKKPIASSLQVFQGELCLFGKFRTIDPDDKSERVEPLAFSLSSASTKTWDDFPSDGLKGWGTDTTFSYQLVNFKDKMLIARALGYEERNPVLKVYVAG